MIFVSCSNLTASHKLLFYRQNFHIPIQSATNFNEFCVCVFVCECVSMHNVVVR